MGYWRNDQKPARPELPIGRRTKANGTAPTVAPTDSCMSAERSTPGRSGTRLTSTHIPSSKNGRQPDQRARKNDREVTKIIDLNGKQALLAQQSA